MGPFHTNPFFLRLTHEFTGFIRQRSGLSLNHVADINLAADNVFHRLVCPFVVDPARIGLSLALVVQHTGGRDAFLIQHNGDSMKPCSGCPHLEDTAHNRGGVLVDHQMVLIRWVPLIAVGGIGSHEFAVFGTGFFDRLDLLACIAAIKFVK